jgi:hypothetical protein
MVAPGSLRERLVQRLNAAYAGGLISDQTLVHRLEEVLHRTLVDPTLLIGDLQLRHRRGGLQDRVSRTVTTAVTTLEKLLHDEASDTLLALNWDDHIGELLIGRSLSCDVMLVDPTVSGRHARLICRDGCWVLQDLSSTNGSYLNGRRVGRCEIRPGDRLILGQTLLRVD